MSLLHRKSIRIDPQPAYRMGRRGRTKNPRTHNYGRYRDELRILARGWTLPADRLYILFEIPMPASWSNKKRLAHFGTPHRQRPDTENLLKAVVDTLYEGNDAQLSDEHGAKVWSDVGYVHVYEDLRAPSPEQLFRDLRGAVE